MNQADQILVTVYYVKTYFSWFGLCFLLFVISWTQMLCWCFLESPCNDSSVLALAFSPLPTSPFVTPLQLNDWRAEWGETGTSEPPSVRGPAQPTSAPNHGVKRGGQSPRPRLVDRFPWSHLAGKHSIHQYFPTSLQCLASYTSIYSYLLTSIFFFHGTEFGLFQ